MYANFLTGEIATATGLLHDPSSDCVELGGKARLSTNTLYSGNHKGRVLKLKNVAASLLFLSCAHTAIAAEPTIQALTFKHPDGRSAPAEIYIDGEITPALPKQLAAALGSNNIVRGTIYINSVGGDLQAGLQLGEYIRKAGFNTAIGKRGLAYGKPTPGSCQSACLMTFAGGVYRFAEPKSFFGIHRFFKRSSDSQDLALGQVLSAAITGYLLRMGVSPVLFERMATSGSTPQQLSVAEATRLNLVNDGVLPTRWEIVGHAGKVFLQGEQKTWNGTGRVQISCSRSEGMAFTAQYDAERNTRQIQADAKKLSLRLDGKFISVSTSGLPRPAEMKDGFLTSTFALSSSTAASLGKATMIGFAWLPDESSIFYGFELPTTGSQDVVYSFLKHCSDS